MTQKLVNTVRLCARCGETHEKLEFDELTNPMFSDLGERWGWWAPCPTNGQPILLKIADPDNQANRRMYAEIENEVIRQTEQWGDEHDDQHSWRDWFALMTRYVVKADVALIEAGDAREWRGRLLQMTAICVSALRSHDRKKRRRT